MTIPPSRTLQRSPEVRDLVGLLTPKEQKAIRDRIEKEIKADEVAKKALKRKSL